MRTESEYDRFPLVKRGYDPEAVESHLSTETDENNRALDEAAAQIAALQTALEESQTHEEAIHLLILAATKAKEDLLEAARHQADEARAAGRQDGDSIITDARMQAFQVVTEARKEADGIVAEARTEAAAVVRSAESTPPTGTAPSEHEIELQKRIEEMQSVIGAMESELRTRPSTSDTTKLEHRQVEESVGAPPVEANTVLIQPEAADDDAGHGEPPPSIAASEIEEHIEIVVTHTAPIAPSDTPVSTIETTKVDDTDTGLDPEPSTDHSSITDDRTADAVRRSFYSRRSAKLPRIGDEAGREALAAVAGLRTNLTPDATKDNSDPDRSQEFETVS